MGILGNISLSLKQLLHLGPEASYTSPSGQLWLTKQDGVLTHPNPVVTLCFLGFERVRSVPRDVQRQGLREHKASTRLPFTDVSSPGSGKWVNRPPPPPTPLNGYLTHLGPPPLTKEGGASQGAAAREGGQIELDLFPREPPGRQQAQAVPRRREGSPRTPTRRPGSGRGRGARSGASRTRPGSGGAGGRRRRRRRRRRRALKPHPSASGSGGSESSAAALEPPPAPSRGTRAAPGRGRSRPQREGSEGRRAAGTGRGRRQRP